MRAYRPASHGNIWARRSSYPPVRTVAGLVLLLLGCRASAPVSAPVPAEDNPKLEPYAVVAAPPANTGRALSPEALALERVHRRLRGAESQYLRDLERWIRADPGARGPKPKLEPYLERTIAAWIERRHREARSVLDHPIVASQPSLDLAALGPVDRVYGLDPTRVDADQYDRAAGAFEPEVAEHAHVLRGLAALARGEFAVAAGHLDGAARAEFGADEEPDLFAAALIGQAVARAEPFDSARALVSHYRLDALPTVRRVIVVTATYIDPSRLHVFVEDDAGVLSFANFDALDDTHGYFAGTIGYADAEPGGAVLIRATSRVDPHEPLVGVVYVITERGVAAHPYALTQGPAVIEVSI